MLRLKSAAVVGLWVSVLLLLAGCGRDIQNKQKVQEAILARLEARSGLDMKSLDVETTSVTFDKNLAYATVAFHPKGVTNVNSGMVMKYTLENRGGKWAVVGVGGSAGHAGMGGPGSATGGATGSGGDLPAGHPPVDGMNPHGAGGSDGSGSGRTQ